MQAGESAFVQKGAGDGVKYGNHRLEAEAKGWLPLLTRFQHKIMIDPRVLNLNLAFQGNIRLCLSREEDRAYFV